MREEEGNNSETTELNLRIAPNWQQKFEEEKETSTPRSRCKNHILYEHEELDINEMDIAEIQQNLVLPLLLEG